MTDLFLLRHAEPVSAGLYTGGGSNPELSENGRLQAKKTSDFFTEHFLPEHEKADTTYILISSALERSIQTVLPLAEKLNKQIIKEKLFNEINFGTWENKSWKEISSEYPELWDNWINDPWNKSPPEGETLRDFKIRIKYALDSLINKYDGNKVLLCAHGGVLRMIFHILLKTPRENFFSVSSDYTGFSRIKIHSVSAAELLFWNNRLT